jgi:hypothetical protein
MCDSKTYGKNEGCMSSEQHDYDADDIHRVANCRKCQADLDAIKFKLEIPEMPPPERQAS